MDKVPPEFEKFMQHAKDLGKIDPRMADALFTWPESKNWMGAFSDEFDRNATSGEVPAPPRPFDDLKPAEPVVPSPDAQDELSLKAEDRKTLDASLALLRLSFTDANWKEFSATLHQAYAASGDALKAEIKRDLVRAYRATIVCAIHDRMGAARDWNPAQRVVCAIALGD